jgi:peptidyl-prolyl cis-trans isomerase C
MAVVKGGGKMRIAQWIVIILLLQGCKKAPTGEAKLLSQKGVVAEINGEGIALSEFNKRYQWYVDRFKYRIPKKTFLENLINLELSAREAIRRGIDKEEKARYDFRILLSQHLLEREVYSKFEKIKLTDKDLEKYFNESPEIRASHILLQVPAGTSPEKEAEIKKRAEEALSRAKAGEDFGKLVKTYSNGPSAKNGGDLDYFTRDSMVKEFSDAAFNLKKAGDLSDLVKTKYGYHIIKLTGVRKFKDADRRRLQSQAMSKKQEAIYNQFFSNLRKNATIRVNEELIEDEEPKP